VKVATTAQYNPWYWDGTYWFGDDGHDGHHRGEIGSRERRNLAT
jgi:hypothetical protein